MRSFFLPFHFGKVNTNCRNNLSVEQIHKTLTSSSSLSHSKTAGTPEWQCRRRPFVCLCSGAQKVGENQIHADGRNLMKNCIISHNPRKQAAVASYVQPTHPWEMTLWLCCFLLSKLAASEPTRDALFKLTVRVMDPLFALFEWVSNFLISTHIYLSVWEQVTWLLYGSQI